MDMVTPALKIWRDAVLTAQSAAQLSMCLSMLYDCVAWEKSIMKVVSSSDTLNLKLTIPTLFIQRERYQRLSLYEGIRPDVIDLE